MSKLDIPANINFALYENPLQRIIGEAVETRIKQEENAAMAHITETIGYKVDKTELIRALNYDRDQFAKGYEAGLNADRWISVKDQLPEECVDVLVWFEYFRFGDYNCLYQTYGIGTYYTVLDSWLVNHESGWQELRIIAWMPLPKPYTGEKMEGVEE